MTIYTTTIPTPIGNMLAGATAEGICLLDFPFRKMINVIKQRIANSLGGTLVEGHHLHFDILRTQLNEYFTGSRTTFDLPVILAGSDFQKKVWHGLQDIPFGETRSYKAQSIYLGNEKAIRAIARANGENGLAIIIPCHRVIGENGSLVGYAGGLRVKEYLLDHERKHSGKSLAQTLF